MLRCPTCNLTYPDGAPPFCEEDGTRLVPDVPTPNPQPTIQDSPSSNAPQPTPAPQQYAPQPQYAPQQQWAQPQVRGGGGSKVMLGVLIGLLLAGGAGVGIYFLTKGSGSSSANNSTLTPNSRSSSTNSGSPSSTSNPSTPTEVWKALYAAAQRRDVEAMKKLVSKGWLARYGDAENMDVLFMYYTSETSDEKIIGDRAMVNIKYKDAPGVHEVIFVKENGSWKFDGFFGA